MRWKEGSGEGICRKLFDFFFSFSGTLASFSYILPYLFFFKPPRHELFPLPFWTLMPGRKIFVIGHHVNQPGDLWSHGLAAAIHPATLSGLTLKLRLSDFPLGRQTLPKRQAPWDSEEAHPWHCFHLSSRLQANEKQHLLTGGLGNLDIEQISEWVLDWNNWPNKIF